MPNDLETRLMTAIASVRNGMTQRCAAREYNVPQSTLSRRLNGGLTRSEAREADRTLGPGSEEIIVKTLLEHGKERTYRQWEVKQLAERILREQGRGDVHIGKHWVSRFMKRHPELITTTTTTTTKSHKDPALPLFDADADDDSEDTVMCSKDLHRRVMDLERALGKMSRAEKSLFEKAGRGLDYFAAAYAAEKRNNEALVAEIERLRRSGYQGGRD
ncbi:hypothetical protein F5Y17DRAFT_165799 [Xylariaceae sp. FL0594]|nr:hypothetical protein F5Y17DRAFT_165799 [Xylariaceae sp. FL0594]